MKKRALTKHEELCKARCHDTDVFTWHNENPHGKMTSDCVIRSIATASGQTWEDTFRDLCALSMKSGYMVDDILCYSKYLKSLGFTKQRQPLQPDGSKYSASRWCRELSKAGFGPYAIVADIGEQHVVCILPTTPAGHNMQFQYKIFDSWNSSKGCVDSYWTKPISLSEGDQTHENH